MVILIIIIGAETVSIISTGGTFIESPLHVILAIPAGVYNFVRIMRYSKRDILKLMYSESLGLGFTSVIKTIFFHAVDLIIIPSLVAMLVFITTYPLGFGIFTLASIVFVGVYIIQVLPLKMKQERYTKTAYTAVTEANEEMKTSRILLTLPNMTSDERDDAIRKHMAAEEMVSINSNFLHVSASFMSTVMGWIRLILPICGTLVGGLYKFILTGGM